MPLISTPIPNLINGVSQQPPSLRMSTQCAEMINCYPSVVEGLVKRPPIEHVEKLISGSVGEAYVHMYQRDTNEKYVVVVRDDSIKVFDLDGVEKTVTTPDGVAYLNSTNPRDDFRLMTVADYTFVVNRTFTPAMNTATIAGMTHKGMVFVKQGTYGGKYEVFVDGVSKALYTTSTSSVGDIATDVIAAGLQSQLVTNLGAGWSTWRVGHVIMIKKDDGTAFTLRTSDPLGGEALKSNTGTVQSLTDLPTTCKHNQIVKVAGDNDSDFDDYWVKFTANDSSFSEGYWNETVGIGAEYSYNAATMPHVLVANGDGTFTFKRATWANRVAGDETSAPDPSFIGSQISDIAFFRDRLVFISGQNVILSTAGDYFNFFPSTVTDVLDDQPIDISASHNKVALIRHAIPFNKQLLLFSDQTQFVLTSDELLTPKTAAITTSTEFETSPNARPVGAGQNVFFVTDKGEFSGVREYFVDSDTETNDAADITSHIPQYIRKGIRSLAVSSAEDVFTLSSDDTTYDHLLYIYKYYWQGSEKLQSSWGKWDLSQEDGAVSVKGFYFVNSTLYIVVQRGSDGLFLERVRLESARLDVYQDFITHLDRRITESECTSVTYDSGTNLTTWTLPYTVRSDHMAVVTRGTVGGATGGREINITATKGSNAITAAGDWSSTDVFIGNKYRAYYEVSEPVLKEASPGGGQVANQSGRLQVRNFSVSYNNTGYFNVKITPKYRGTYENPFTGRITGAGANILGVPALDEGVHKSSVMANSKEVTVEIESWSPMPMKLQSAEWEIFWSQRSARR